MLYLCTIYASSYHLGGVHCLFAVNPLSFLTLQALVHNLLLQLHWAAQHKVVAALIRLCRTIPNRTALTTLVPEPLRPPTSSFWTCFKTQHSSKLEPDTITHYAEAEPGILAQEQQALAGLAASQWAVGGQVMLAHQSSSGEDDVMAGGVLGSRDQGSGSGGPSHLSQHGIRVLSGRVDQGIKHLSSLVSRLEAAAAAEGMGGNQLLQGLSKPPSGALGVLMQEASGCLGTMQQSLQSLERSIGALQRAAQSSAVSKVDMSALTSFSTRLVGELSSVTSRTRTLTDQVHRLRQPE